MKKIIIATITLISLFGLTACGSPTLKGDYKYTSTTLFGNKSAETLKFEDDKVSLIGNKNSYHLEGTYKLSKDRVEINIKNYNEVARLSKDKKTLTFESNDGLISKGKEYTKENE
jgi:hypothetical protein